MTGLQEHQPARRKNADATQFLGWHTDAYGSTGYPLRQLQLELSQPLFVRHGTSPPWFSLGVL